MGIIVFILWLVLAFVVAAGAKNKGSSYGGFHFVFSFNWCVYTPYFRGKEITLWKYY